MLAGGRFLTRGLLGRQAPAMSYAHQKHEREQRRADRCEMKERREAERRDEPQPIRLEDVYGADEEPEGEP